MSSSQPPPPVQHPLPSYPLRSYREFITAIHLPAQLAEVDPVVASFCGGAIGVITTLLIVETNNVKLR